MAEEVAKGIEAGWIAEAVMKAARDACIGIVVTQTEPDGTLRNVYVSEPAAEMAGRTTEELLAGSPYLTLAPGEEERLRARAERRALGEDEARTYDVQVMKKDGTIFPVEVTVCFVEHQGRRVVVSFGVDITQRRTAEQRVLKSEELFRTLIERAPEPIGITRGDRFLYVNPAYVRILGYASADEVLAKRISELTHPDDIDILRRRAGVLYAGGYLPGPYAYRGKRRDGSHVLLEISAIVIDYEGAPALLGFARDVTERRRLEAQLVQADRLAALGTMAAGVAHEVNNPLAYLLLNLESLERQLPDLARDPSRIPELATMLRDARHGAERVGAIVRELRAFSRADADTRRPVDLQAVALAAIRMTAHEVRHRGKVLTEFEATPPVWANEARLEQVLLNLLINAAQALPDGMVDRNEIRLRVFGPSPDRAMIEVRDNGMGIPPESVRRIFDPFFTTKPVGIGTGLGLSICHTIVTSLGGDISVESTVGEGSTFRIVLPTCRTDVEEIGPTEAAPRGGPPSRTRAHILVIDDEVAIARTLCDSLKGEHDVSAVSRAQEALERVRDGAGYDIILCDLMMPDMTGMDLYERLRTERPGLEDRLVFMTGGAFTARSADFLSRVPNRRLEKPFSLSALEELVRDVLRSSPSDNESEHL